MNLLTLNSLQIKTPLGTMLALADEKFLYLLDFVDRKGLNCAVENLKKAIYQDKDALPINTSGRCPDNNDQGKDVFITIKRELHAYFAGELKVFTTPIFFHGTSFQQQVWRELMLIPYGETLSYAAQAHRLHNPTAYRAVANANGMNRLLLIVPCHRVINSNGKLGGYGGGLSRKKWLLEHEKKSWNQ